MSTTTRQPLRQPAPANGVQKRTTLSDIRKTGRNLPSRVVLHGVGGVGKTSWAAYAPHPLFILSPGENGLETLMDQGQIPQRDFVEFSDWLDLLAFLQDFRTSEHDYKSLVFDVLDGFVGVAKGWALPNKFDNDDGPKGWLNYSAGERFIASTMWPELLNTLDRIREDRKMAIVGLAHTTQATYKNPRGPDYDRFVPAMYKDIWSVTYGWADMVLFANHEVFTKQAKGEKKGKAFGGQVRVMQTVQDATADAKNRHGMIEPIPMGETGKEAWDNFLAAVKAGRGTQQ
jgi:hypothetical protein